MPLGPFELDDEHWEKILEFLARKGRELGVGGEAGRLLLIKQFWLTLQDQTALDRFNDEQKLDKLTAHRTILDDGRTQLDADITELEGKLNR